MTDCYTCPVCGYSGLTEEPRSDEGGASYEICWSCGFQFGWSDDERDHTYETYRAEWVARGMPWDSAEIRNPPPNWNPARQLQQLLDGGAQSN